MEGKTNFSRCLKPFDGLICLTLIPLFYATGQTDAKYFTFVCGPLQDLPKPSLPLRMPQPQGPKHGTFVYLSPTTEGLCDPCCISVCLRITHKVVDGFGSHFSGQLTMGLARASELILEWGRRGEAQRAESGIGVLGEGQPAPPHQLGVCGSAASSPSPGRRRVFLCSVASDCLSQHLSIRVAYSLHG